MMIDHHTLRYLVEKLEECLRMALDFSKLSAAVAAKETEVAALKTELADAQAAKATADAEVATAQAQVDALTSSLTGT